MLCVRACVMFLASALVAGNCDPNLEHSGGQAREGIPTWPEVCAAGAA